MARKKSANPTDRELAILRVLWDHGPSTVRRVHAALSEESETGYTTTLKLMQIMTEKGLVSRNESQRTHIYRPAADESEVQKNLAEDLLQKAFGGSARKLVMQALKSKAVPKKELDKIKKMLDKLEGEEK